MAVRLLYAGIADSRKSPQSQHKVINSSKHRYCNGKRARRKQCKCAIACQRCTSCQPFKNSWCYNTDMPSSVSLSSTSSQSSIVSNSQPFIFCFKCSPAALNIVYKFKNTAYNKYRNTIKSARTIPVFSCCQTSTVPNMETLGSPVSDADFFTQFILKKHRAALDLLSAIKQIGTIDP